MIAFHVAQYSRRNTVKIVSSHCIEGGKSHNSKEVALSLMPCLESKGEAWATDTKLAQVLSRLRRSDATSGTEPLLRSFHSGICSLDYR